MHSAQLLCTEPLQSCLHLGMRSLAVFHNAILLLLLLLLLPDQNSVHLVRTNRWYQVPQLVLGHIPQLICVYYGIATQGRDVMQ